jgi:hypothetical protein
MRLIKLFFVLIAITSIANAQNGWQKKIKLAWGKEKDWQTVKTLSYHLQRWDGEGNFLSEADFVLDFIHQSVKEIKVVKGDTIINFWQNQQSFQQIRGLKNSLPMEDAQRLSAVLYYNFFNFFIRKNIAFEFLRSTEYQGIKANLIRIKDVEKKQSDLDIWVDAKNHLILTSSTWEEGKYSYFADESDYQKIYKTLKFPLVFEIIENGKKIRKGVFSNCRVNQ